MRSLLLSILLAAGSASADPSSLLPDVREGDDDVREAVRAGLEAGRPVESARFLSSVSLIEAGGRVIGRVETWARRDPPAMKEILEMSGVAQAAVLVDDVAYLQDANGRVREATGDEAATYRLAHALLFHTYLDGDPDGFSTDVTPTRLVFLPRSDGAARSLEVRREDDLWLPFRFHQRQQGVDVTTTFEEWRPVDGIRFPFVSVQSTGDERFDLTLRTQTVSHPDSIDAERFHVPAGDEVPDAEILDAVAAAAIPVERIGSLWLIEGKIHDRPVRCLLDTGAAATVLSSRLAAALGLPARGLVEARGAGGSEEARFVDVDRFTLPGVVVRDQTVVTLPFDQIHAALAVPVDVILGYDFLSRFAVELDAPRRTLALLSSGDYRPRPGAKSMPLRIEANVPRIAAVIDGRHRGNLLFDLGNAAPLVLHTAFATEHGYLDRAEEGDAMTGIGGVETMRRVTLETVEVGDVRFDDVPASIAVSATGVLAMDESIGNLGSGLFTNSVLAFDYGAGSFWIAPSVTAEADSSR